MLTLRPSTLARTLALTILGTVPACADHSPVSPETRLRAAAPMRAQSAGQAGSQAEITNTPVSFEINGPACGLPSNVTGQGTLETVLRTTTTHNGEVTTFVRSTARGTASDADGQRYKWTYQAQERTVAPGVFPFTIRVTDQFHLLGEGSARNYKTQFHLFVTFNGPNDLTLDFTHERGDIQHCDPI